MLKTIKKFGFLSLMFLGILSELHAADKIYIDSDELNTAHDIFHIHTGNNVWIETNTIHRDATGLYIFESNIARSTGINSYESEYRKTWKCPYCHNYWPIGIPCQKEDCPSKYK